ncbi:MAG: SRPBCC domain-containing protein [Saprospiraceae bacterium]|nr:SRPBCC domain-containing protein [Saprospiraceae bacterium]
MHSIHHLLHISAPQEKVFQQLATLSGVQKWWSVQAHGDYPDGGMLHVDFDERFKNVFQLMFLREPHEVIWKCLSATAPEWMGTEIVFSLDRHEEKTRVRITHRGYPEESDFMAQCNYSWGRYLDSLRLLCEAGEGLPYKGKIKEADPAEMKRVTGLGGVFFKAKDPKALSEWYGRHLGLVLNPYGSVFEFRPGAEPEKVGYTAWSPMPLDTDYYAPSDKSFMFNYRVQNLEWLIKTLKEEGVEVVGEIEAYEYGKFAHILDPDGTKVELWEPVDPVFTKLYQGKTTK